MQLKITGTNYYFFFFFVRKAEKHDIANICEDHQEFDSKVFMWIWHHDVPPVLTGTRMWLCEAGPWGWRREGGAQLQRLCWHRKLCVSACACYGKKMGRDMEKGHCCNDPLRCWGRNRQNLRPVWRLKHLNTQTCSSCDRVFLFVLNAQVVLLLLQQSQQVGCGFESHLGHGLFCVQSASSPVSVRAPSSPKTYIWGKGYHL